MKHRRMLPWKPLLIRGLESRIRVEFVMSYPVHWFRQLLLPRIRLKIKHGCVRVGSAHLPHHTDNL